MLGTIKLLTPDRVVAAALLVITGEVISLDLPLNQPDPPLFGRAPYRHEVFALNRNEMDDRVDGLHPQGSSQWDGLAHVRCREFGYWGGRQVDPGTGSDELGIEHWAEHGIVGRGVLVDLPHWAERRGVPHGPLGNATIAAADLAAALADQGKELETGDILLVRTGCVSAYRELDRSGRE